MDHNCAVCGRPQQLVDGAQPNLNEAPTDGAVMICWRCNGISLWDGASHGRTRLPTSEELTEIMADPDVRAALQISTTSSTPSEAVRRINRAP